MTTINLPTPASMTINLPTPVAIHGSRFRAPGFSGPTAVHLGPTNGETNVTDLVVVSDKLLTCKLPVRDPSWPARVSLWVTTPFGVGVRHNAFHFVPDPAFAVLSISPTSGHYSGGTAVTIIGYKFNNAIEVVWDVFGDEHPAGFVIDSDNQITATSPGGTQYAPYGIKVRLSTGEEFAFKCNDVSHPAWMYSGDPVIEVDYCEPARASWVGGTLITIKGRGFVDIGLVDVSFLALSSIAFTVIDDETATFISPDPATVFFGPYDSISGGEQGTCEIWFYQNGGSPITSTTFSFDKLTIEDIAPPQVSRDGGEVVTMRGRSLDSITEIHIIDDNLITDVDVFASMTIVSPEEITFVMPPIDPGSYDTLRIQIVGQDPKGYGEVEGIGGVVVIFGQDWRWAATIDVLPGSVPARPIAIVPNTDVAAGGAAIVIEVADTTDLIDATIDGVSILGFTIDDATHVSGTVPAHGAGPTPVGVQVVNVYGASAPLYDFIYT